MSSISHCETVVFSVIAFKTDKDGKPIKPKGKVASLHYSWNKPVSQNNPDFNSDSTRTKTAEGILKLLRKILERDEIYKKRWEQHYHMIREETNLLSSLMSAERLTGPIAQGRNELCGCGSGKKYKKCCLSKDAIGNILFRDK